MRIIAGLYKNRALTAPKGQLTRPTSEKLREALFNICQTYIEGASFLDLFAGSGAIGLEALSRGASGATLVDSSRECVKAIKENIQKFGLEQNVKVFLGDVFEQLRRLQKQGQEFDIIFADPPYDLSVTVKGVSKSSIQYLAELLDEGTLLKPRGMLFFERPGHIVLTESSWKNLEHVGSRHFGRSYLDQYQRREGSP